MTEPCVNARRSRKFSLRWHGRRWYDPNERKIIWPTVCLALLAAAVRVFVVGSAAGHPTPRNASTTLRQKVA